MLAPIILKFLLVDQFEKNNLNSKFQKFFFWYYEYNLHLQTPVRIQILLASTLIIKTFFYKPCFHEASCYNRIYVKHTIVNFSLFWYRAKTKFPYEHYEVKGGVLTLVLVMTSND